VLRPVEVLSRFASAHGLGGRAIVPMRATGIANDIWALGDDFVLRVGRDWDEAWSDARTESVAVPVARAAGVRTPALVVFDDSRAVIDAAVTVYERVHGDTMGLVLASRADWSAAMRGIGRDLARLHLGVTAVADPNGWLDDPGTEDPRRWLEPCAPLLGEQIEFFSRWLDRLEPAARTRVQPRFLHDDVHAFNIMVDAHGEYLALLDWGDAGWGDPAIELATFAIDWIDPLVEAYAEAAPELVDDGFGARVLWNQIGHSLRKTAKPRPGRSAALGRARLHRLAAFVRAGASRWRAWSPDG
jgi:aminoglycoside phosphotransferase (APT) family kinase protein